MFPAIALDLVDEGQALKAATANGLWEAMSHNALYGIKSISGLVVTFYGGNINIAGEPTPIASQALTMTASTTNYIYSTAAGVFTKTTSIPGSWPGPLAADAIAMYEIVTGTSTVTVAGSTNWICGTGQPGAAGTQGDTGPEGSQFVDNRTRLWTATGGGSTTVAQFGWDAFTVSGSSATARTLAGGATLRESIPYVAYPTGAGAAARAQLNSPRNFAYLGDAAGRGGFTLHMRFCLESTSTTATQGCFFGLIPVPGTITDVEPDTFVSCIGVGSKKGDANLSIIHNDGSGTATMVPLGSGFPARSTDKVYELLLTCVGNTGIVSYSVTDRDTPGSPAASTINSNLPANTTFLAALAWLNNGSAGGVATFGMMQVVGITRY